MKKLTRIVVLLVLICIFITGCGNKKALTAAEFSDKMSAENKYLVYDATNQFSNYDYIKKVYIVADKDANYQLEFYELDSTENAISFIKSNRKTFENAKGKSSVESEVEIANYYKYTLKSNKKYKVLSRIDSTAVYVDVDETYKDQIDKILEEIGY